jgi:hypothetical protein
MELNSNTCSLQFAKCYHICKSSLQNIFKSDLSLIPAQCRRIAESPAFSNLILGVIIFTAVLMGLETSAPLMAAYGSLFRVLNGAVQAASLKIYPWA